MLWANDGQLYVPVNGSASGGNVPGPLPIHNTPVSEDDWLFRIVPGKYYGHPNPHQGHYVMNGGNPTGHYDFAEMPGYPVGTQPDPDWVRAAYVFGKHASANGIIQYKSHAFGGKLTGKLLVCRYSVPGDVTVLELGLSGKVTHPASEIAGFSNLSNPLDLIEDPATGCIYVSEYGARCITLLRLYER